VTDIGQIGRVLDDLCHERGAFLLPGELELHQGFDDGQAPDLTGEKVDFPGRHPDAVFAGDDFVHFAGWEGGEGGREGGEGRVGLGGAESGRER